MLRPASQIEGERRKALASFVGRIATERPAEPVRVLEIGSQFGDSAIIWAQAIREHANGHGRVVCVDPWGPSAGDAGQLLPSELAPQFASGEAYEKFRTAIAAAGVGSLVQELRGTSDAMLPGLAPASFDIVYVDGDHTYAQVRADLQHAQRLLRDGGVLCGDDLELLFEETNQPLALKWAELGVDYVHDPQSGLWFHPGVTLAVYRAFRRVSRFGKTWAVQRTGENWGLLVP